MKSLLVVALANGNWTLVQFRAVDAPLVGHGLLHGVNHGDAQQVVDTMMMQIAIRAIGAPVRPSLLPNRAP
ncbi:hypothetical protein [Paraburkholderia hospita]|uniref:hypothetical protein n=1 Tax=Paraburkholderia hospita TaxID=169430 RepID=UPI000B346853|nr:hypothetical protein [Paraburkholderia hospita]OUL73818.1 hypothetical protein CA603_43085 [Paraburkholderia hospita]